MFYNKLIACFFTCAVLLSSCAKVPVTNRKQVSLIPESELISMSLTEYKSFLTKNSVVTVSDPDAQMVKNVGKKIQASVTAFLAQKKIIEMN